MLFLEIQSINIVYPNVKNMIIMPITKRMKIITSIKVVQFYGWALITRKMVERKAFLANPKHQYRVSQCREQGCSANKKKMEIIRSIHVCFISWMNFDYKENGGKKSFSWKSKASISCILVWKHDSYANNEKNWDYYEFSSLSHFVDELWL